MATEKAILCVLFEEFSDLDEICINMFNTAKYAQCYSHCHSYEKHLITIVYEIWYINKLALQ